MIDIDEPSLEDAIEILKGITPAYAEFHGNSYEDEAIEQAARMALSICVNPNFPTMRLTSLTKPQQQSLPASSP